MTTTEERASGEVAPPPRARRARVLLVTAVVLLVAVAALVVRLGGDAGAPGGGASWTPKPHRAAESLDHKHTCTQTHTVSVAEDFGKWLGRPVDCVVIFNTDKDWGTLTHPWFVHYPPEGQDWPAWKAEAPEERFLVVSQSLVPKDAPEDWRERGAAGEYDEHWRTFGQELVEAGLGDSVIRLAWEMNGDWYPNHYVGETAEQREQWIAYWRRAVEAMEVPGASFEIDFNIAEGLQDSVDLAELYPGDDWVDIIGVDVYDSYVAPIDPEARWQERADEGNSLQAVADFAAERDKPISLPEWAMVAPGASNGGGDSPDFIHRVADVVASTPTYYQSYFNVRDGGVGMTLRDAPQGSAAFLERFGDSGDAAPRSP